MYIHIWVCVPEWRCLWGWNRVTDPLGVELRAIIVCLTWVVGNKPRYSARTVFLSCWVISPGSLHTYTHILNNKTLGFLHESEGKSLLLKIQCNSIMELWGIELELTWKALPWGLGSYSTGKVLYKLLREKQ